MIQAITIQGLAISKDVATAITDNGLIIIVVGTHHGNEYGATETVTKAFAEALAAQNPIPWTNIIYVIPVLNVVWL